MVKKSKKAAQPIEKNGFEKAGSSSSSVEAAVEAALEKAQACADQLAYDEALEHYRAALKLAPDDVAVLDGMGEVCMQLGDMETAQQVLQRSVELAPDADAGRYMYLGQMCEGEDALRWFETGVARLRQERGALEQASGSRTELQERWAASTHALATALCSVAEMYLTDFCDEPEAEQRCEALATEAVELVQGLQAQVLAEPYQTLASLRLSQERPAEAAPLLDKTLEVIQVRLCLAPGRGVGGVRVWAATLGAVGGGAAAALRRVVAHNPLPPAPPPLGQATLDTPAQPSFEFRMSTAKLLMEVERPLEAVELLQALRMEEDESLELWYLLGCAALQAEDVELAGAEVAAALEFAQSDACPDEERAWMEQLQELQADIAEASEAAL